MGTLKTKRAKKIRLIPIEKLRPWINAVLEYYKNDVLEKSGKKDIAKCITSSIIKTQNSDIKIYWVDSKKFTNTICSEIDILLKLSDKEIIEVTKNLDANEEQDKVKLKSKFQNILNDFVPRRLKTNLRQYGIKSEHIFTPKDIYAEIDNETNAIPNLHFSISYLDKLYVFLKKNKLINVLILDEEYKQFKETQETRTDSNEHLQKVPEVFINTYWYCYERIQKGIVRHIINIKDRRGLHTEVEVTCFIYDEEGKEDSRVHIHTYHGKADCLITGESVFLVMDLIRKNSPNTPAIFFMRVHQDRLNTQKISIGHYTFYSINYSRFHTKLVLWNKIEETKDFNFMDLKSKPVYLPLNTKERFQVESNIQTQKDQTDLLIKKYLVNRNLSKLTMPRTALSVLLDAPQYSLQKWIEKNRINDEDKNALIGEYWCYYCVEPLIENEPIDKINENIFSNKFIILKDLYTDFFHVFFYHSLETSHIFWYGGFRFSQNTKTMEFHLMEATRNQPISTKDFHFEDLYEPKYTGNGTLSVIISLPNKFEANRSEISKHLMIGLIMDDKGCGKVDIPTSYIALIKKGDRIDLKSDTDEDAQKIIDFFKRNRGKLSLSLENLSV